jgi:hypothetical protein
MRLRFDQLRLLLPPVTPRGVAVCAQGNWRQLFVVQLLVATLSGLTVLWFVSVAWLPVVRQAISALPTQGEIVNGQLHWRSASPTVLAENHFLALGVNVGRLVPLGRPAHLRVEFSSTNVLVCSLLGCVPANYPQQWKIAFNSLELEPWWGAREPFVCFGLACLTIAGVWISWQVLSLCYFLFAWLAAAFAGRVLNLRGAWLLSGASVVPGAFVMLITIGLYGLGALDVVRLLFGTGLHFVCGWVYLIAAIFFLPRAGSAVLPKLNPFQTRTAAEKQNPFESSGGDAP